MESSRTWILPLTRSSATSTTDRKAWDPCLKVSLAHLWVYLILWMGRIVCANGASNCPRSMSNTLSEAPDHRETFLHTSSKAWIGAQTAFSQSARQCSQRGALRCTLSTHSSTLNASGKPVRALRSSSIASTHAAQSSRSSWVTRPGSRFVLDRPRTQPSWEEVLAGGGAAVGGGGDSASRGCETDTAGGSTLGNSSEPLQVRAAMWLKMSSGRLAVWFLASSVSVRKDAKAELPSGRVPTPFKTAVTETARRQALWSLVLFVPIPSALTPLHGPSKISARLKWSQGISWLSS
mmetsp:Transcript_27786/g.82952  ORF Transcript_27786/g.82952 Transcript_27786/m.82952 type:complete len:293 (-) Transcript_27786:425-1303(-)